MAVVAGRAELAVKRAGPRAALRLEAGRQPMLLPCGGGCQNDTSGTGSPFRKGMGKAAAPVISPSRYRAKSGFNPRRRRLVGSGAAAAQP